MLSSASNEYVRESLNGRCDQRRLTDGIRTLLGLYYLPNETTEERARQIAVFIADLAEFSDDAVWWAMREWRRTQDRRPSPASLRQLCMMRRQEAVRASKVSPPTRSKEYREPTEAEKARVRAMMEAAGYSPKRMPKAAS